MKITTTQKLDEKSEILVLGLFEEDKDNLRKYSVELAHELNEIIKKKIFSPKFGEMYSTKVVGLHYRRVVVVGLGKKEELTCEKVRRLMGKIMKGVKGLKAESFCTNIAEEIQLLKLFKEEELGRVIAEGLILADYQFTKYLSKEKLDQKKIINEISLVFVKEKNTDFFNGLRIGRTIAEGTNFAKDLVNEPASVNTPAFMEKMAAKVAASNRKIKMRVMNAAEMQSEGLHALLGVSRGSVIPPRLIFLEYNGGGKEEKVAIIGKGITFDSGGYNLKPTGGIEDMKCDMAGAAAVLATIKVAAELGLKKNILGVMPLCENMIGGTAQKPGDIVRAYNGKTIEIRNTDAEGRLILADALAYTEAKYKPAVMIDLATLTGACVVALGYYTAGIMGNEELIKDLFFVGEKSGDRVWPLPFFEDYQDVMDGTISDLRNISSKGKGYEAGAISGGVFLSKFVAKAKWVHIDIAGSAFFIEETDYTQKGGTGAGVRLLSYYFMRE